MFIDNKKRNIYKRNNKFKITKINNKSRQRNLTYLKIKLLKNKQDMLNLIKFINTINNKLISLLKY